MGLEIRAEFEAFDGSRLGSLSEVLSDIMFVDLSDFGEPPTVAIECLSAKPAGCFELVMGW